MIEFVQKDITDLLEFESACLFVYDEVIGDLKVLMYDKETDRLARIEDPTGYERCYNFDQKQVVRFPKDMGVTGFVLENNSVNFVDHFDQIMIQSSKATPTSLCFSLDNAILGEAAFKILNRRLTEHNPFCNKVDNFLNKEKLFNVVFSSLQDEAELDNPLSVGVM